jgi:arylsulfatase A-like enzyme
MRPNVLLVVLDAVRADHLSAYGHDRPTSPTLGTLAASGVTFESAFSNSNWTGTSHGALFTGRLPSDSGIYGNRQVIPDGVRTLPERLSEAGYRTFAASAGAHVRAERGYDRGIDAFLESHDYGIRLDGEFLGRVARDGPFRRQVLQDVLWGPDVKTVYKLESFKQWVVEESTPFFGFLNLKTAHHPYDPPRPYKSMYADLARPRYEFLEHALSTLRGDPQRVPGLDVDRLLSISRGYPVLADDIEPTDAEWDAVRAWYDGAIRYLDERVGELIQFLDRRGLSEETYVILTADHGEQFGEHGLEKHYFSLYDDLLHVPLIVHPPGGTEPRRWDTPVSLVDLVPTILELAAAPAPGSEHATSLLPLDEPPESRYTFAEVGRKGTAPIRRRHPGFTDSEHNGPLQAIRDEEWKLIRRNDGRTELYRWREGETEDRSGDCPDVRGRLCAALEDHLDPLDDAPFEESVTSPALADHLEELGYL